MNLRCVTYSLRIESLRKTGWLYQIKENPMSVISSAYCICLHLCKDEEEWMSPVGGGVRRWLVAPTSPHTTPPERRDSPLSSSICRPTGRVSSQRVQHHHIGWSYWVMLCGLSIRLYIRIQRAQNTEHDLSGSRFTNSLLLVSLAWFFCKSLLNLN